MWFIYSIFIILGFLKSQSLNGSHVREKKNQITNRKQDSASVFPTPWPFPQRQNCSSSGPSCCDFYLFIFAQCCGSKCLLKCLPLDLLLLISLVRKWSDIRDGLVRVLGQGLSTSHSGPGEIRRPTSTPPSLVLYNFLKKIKMCIYLSTINIFLSFVYLLILKQTKRSVSFTVLLYEYCSAKVASLWPALRRERCNVL